jgi:hypothetical protein
VKAKGKNKTTTFWPFKSAKEVAFLSVSNKVKAGAGLPSKLLILIGFLLFYD